MSLEPSDTSARFLEYDCRPRHLDRGWSPATAVAIRTQGYAPDHPDNCAVSRNGQKFLINTVVAVTDHAPLEVTLNWTAALPK